jgi:CDP-glucose 4,6-dehydratase
MISKNNSSQLENFYLGKKIFLTGHTGFKGSWLALLLTMMGAKVIGYALKAEEESLFELINLESWIESSIIADITNLDNLKKSIANCQPSIVIHMAAQSLVRASYLNPVSTFNTNIIGTANLFEAIRAVPSIHAVVNVTSDKCYENKENMSAYKEEDQLGGRDPYSASKACAELITSSYWRSFFMPQKEVMIASARAGNVIGGGDFSSDRIIPDIVKAIKLKKILELRSPQAIRPWQHVLDPLYGYLILAKQLFQASLRKDISFCKAYNFGPPLNNEVNVEQLSKEFISKIGLRNYKINSDTNLIEAGILKLNSSLAQKELKWSTKLDFKQAVDWSASWYQNYLQDGDVKDFTIKQIENYLNIISNQN